MEIKKREENILEECRDKAIESLKTCFTENGLFASGGKNGYRGVWARDSMISLMGASTGKKDLFKEQFKKSLITLKKHQSRHGQIPNAVLNFEAKHQRADYISIDSSLWFILGEHAYKKMHGSSLFKAHKNSIDKALTWLGYQDIEENILLEQLPTTDWQDAFPHKYGSTINTQAIYYMALKLSGKAKEAEKLKKLANEDREHKLWNGKFYYAYRWKNHGKYREIGEWFDSLGNLLAIIFGLAEKEQAEKIISYIKQKKINEPYPAKAIYPPIKKGGKEWQDYFLDCEAGKAYHYLNAGTWPYIGGFYILALIKLKKFKEAEEELKKLAESNLKGNFPEWVNPLTKSFHGRLQAWDAGMYIAAYESFRKKKALF